MRAIHVIGLILWRGGLLLAGGALLYQAARFVLRFIEVPVALEVGLALGIAGFVFVMASLVAERIQDARRERGEAP